MTILLLSQEPFTSILRHSLPGLQSHPLLDSVAQWELKGGGYFSQFLLKPVSIHRPISATIHVLKMTVWASAARAKAVSFLVIT